MELAAGKLNFHRQLLQQAGHFPRLDAGAQDLIGPLGTKLDGKGQPYLGVDVYHPRGHLGPGQLLH